MTSTDGRCVARIRWMPAARAFCAMRATLVSTSFGAHHHEVGELVDHDDDVRQLVRRRLAVCRLLLRAAIAAEISARISSSTTPPASRTASSLAATSTSRARRRRPRRSLIFLASMLGRRVGELLVDLLVVRRDVAHAHLREQIVAALHLLDGPAQREVRLLRIGHDRQQQVRDALVDRELEHLRVDHDHPHVFGRAVKSSEEIIALTATDLPEPVVPATSRCGICARSTTAGPPSMSLPSAIGSLRVGLAERLVDEDLLQEHLLARLVRHLDADRGLARNRRDDAHAQRLERQREVVGQADDLVDAVPGAGANSYIVTTGPGRIATTSPLTP